ncbi:MAG: hypothetical protein FK734_06310, partial [Asgard group archaeon]|nr:hypothetical protein [Asgard group archaeon]
MTIANDQVTLETNPSNEAKHENKIESKLLSKKVLFDGFIVAIFSFGFNFITTAEYAFFSPIMNDFGLNDDLKISIILSIALFSLCIGVM